MSRKLFTVKRFNGAEWSDVSKPVSRDKAERIFNNCIQDAVIKNPLYFCCDNEDYIICPHEKQMQQGGMPQ